MAKQMGAMRFNGRFGNAIGYGSDYVRAEGKTPSNPKSTAQCIQRMICATVAQAMSALQVVCSNSVQGKKRGSATMSYLRGEWMKMLRVSNIFDAENLYGYVKKGSQLLALNPYMISRGSLPTIGAKIFDPDEAMVDIPGIGEVTDSASASQLFPMVALGNQITIVAVKQNDGITLEGEHPYVVNVCRFAFKDDSVPALILSNGALHINPAAVDLAKADGAWNAIIFDDNEHISLSDPAFAGNYLGAVAVIQSNIASNQRSTEFLTIANFVQGVPFSASQAVGSYSAEGTPVDTVSDVYLDNSTTPDAPVEGLRVTRVVNDDTGVSVALADGVYNLRGTSGTVFKAYLNRVLDAADVSNISQSGSGVGTAMEAGDNYIELELTTTGVAILEYNNASIGVFNCSVTV